jgi:hypothetical protein
MRIQSWLGSLSVQARDLFEPPLSADPLPVIPPDRARAVLVSFYMPNIPRRVVAAQRRLLKRFSPPDVAIAQIMTVRSHEHALNHFMATTRYRVVVFLDIDCVPLRNGAIERLVGHAESGSLAGASQCASHLRNANHLYVGPFCLALTRDTYDALGRRPFTRTSRADVGEELTFAAQEHGLPVHFLWPTASDDHIWQLSPGRTYGHGTTYDDDFWHAFEIRLPSHHEKFVARCAEFERAASA